MRGGGVVPEAGVKAQEGVEGCGAGLLRAQYKEVWQARARLIGGPYLKVPLIQTRVLNRNHSEILEKQWIINICYTIKN